jgi:LysM repeat protein
MRHWKRLVYYLIINVLVSACTILAVLAIWDRTHPAGIGGEPLAQAIASGTPQAVAGSSAEPGNIPEDPAASPPASNPTSTPPAATETERPELEYRIQPGDTLGDVAVRFDVTVDDLMEANGITDPDRLEVGQTLIIPASESVEPTQEPPPDEETEPVEITETPVPPTQTPPVVTGEAKVLIDSVVGAGDLDSERVLLKRAGAGELSLAGWQIVEEEERIFIFPQLTLFEGGAVNLHTRAGQPTVVDLFWGLEEPVWQSGERVVLMDDQGEVQATYEVP